MPHIFVKEVSFFAFVKNFLASKGWAPGTSRPEEIPVRYFFSLRENSCAIRWTSNRFRLLRTYSSIATNVRARHVQFLHPCLCCSGDQMKAAIHSSLPRVSNLTQDDESIKPTHDLLLPPNFFFLGTDHWRRHDCIATEFWTTRNFSCITYHPSGHDEEIDLRNRAF